MPNRPHCLITRRTGLSEIDVINGAVKRNGHRVGVPVPVNATLTALIKAAERTWTDPISAKDLSWPG